MSILLKASGIAERALRKIGAFSINHTAADPEELAEALYWLDLNVAEFSGTERCPWLVPATLSLTLAANTQTYDLADAISAAAPINGIVFPLEAWLRNSSGLDTPIKLLRRQEYEDLDDKDETGEPQCVFIDRLAADSQLTVWPVPSTTGYTLRLTVQTYAPDVADGTATQGGNTSHGFAAEWQRWLILQTAADIGSGPVRRLPGGEVREIRTDAEQARNRLSYSNREKPSQPRRTRPSGA